MNNPVNSIIRRSQYKAGDKLNVLTYVSHERYEPSLCATTHDFYSVIVGETRTWNEQYSPIPPNYHIYQEQVPTYIANDIDLVIIHNAAVQLQYAQQFHNIPIINVFHTMPTPGMDDSYFDNYQALTKICTKNVFISNFNMHAWKFSPQQCDVIHHGIDDKLFVNANTNREPVILSVANDYINRDWALGFQLWQAVTQGRNVLPVGKTPGFSEPAKNLTDMIRIYNKSRIFLNTSLASPIPMSLLEAMLCGCACVSTNTCMIPDIIEHGVDGFICSPRKPDQFTKYLDLLSNDAELANKMGQKARAKIQKMFSLDNFTTAWNNLLVQAINDYR